MDREYKEECWIEEIQDYNPTCLINNAYFNCTVLGHWFYLLSAGNDPEVNSIGLDDAAEIVFDAAKYYFVPEMDYYQAREYTIMAAKDRNNDNICASEVQSVVNAWNAVDIETNIASSFNITGTISTDKSYMAGQSISASCLINNNANVQFIAGNEILISNNFELTSGCALLLNIADINCQ